MLSHEDHLASIVEASIMEAAKQSAINTNLPSWSQVETALDGISNLAEAKAALKKISRIIYWLAKGKGE